jgi:hypothetical protein
VPVEINEGRNTDTYLEGPTDEPHLVVVRRKADGAKGSLEFQSAPRFFFNFEPDTVSGR